MSLNQSERRESSYKDFRNFSPGETLPGLFPDWKVTESSEDGRKLAIEKELSAGELVYLSVDKGAPGVSRVEVKRVNGEIVLARYSMDEPGFTQTIEGEDPTVNKLTFVKGNSDVRLVIEASGRFEGALKANGVSMETSLGFPTESSSSI